MKAAPRALSQRLALPGEIRLDEDRTAHLFHRAAGVVEQVSVGLGQAVQKGDLLAVIASPQVSEHRSELAAAERRVRLARTTFERERQLWQEGISAEQDYLMARQALDEAEIALATPAEGQRPQWQPRPGRRQPLRVARAPSPHGGGEAPGAGEVVNESSAAFTLSDLSRVWATFSVSPRDLARVRVGRPSPVSARDLGPKWPARCLRRQPAGGAEPHRHRPRHPGDPDWPGARVCSSACSWPPTPAQVPVAVPEAAVQMVEDRSVVFVRTDTGFATRPVTLGARDQVSWR